MIDYHANALEIENRGLAEGAERWAIIATYCYVRRFHPSAWLLRIEKWESGFVLYWTKTLAEKDEHATILSKLWAKKTFEQPDPLDASADSWIETFEREEAIWLEKRAKQRKKDGDGKQKTQDVMLSDNQAPVISFKREPKQESSDYDKLLDNLF